MTYEQYWGGDPALARDYLKADEIRSQRRNGEMWLQGRYVYDAICMASPILNDFAERGTRPMPYLESPYPLSEGEAKRAEEERRSRNLNALREYLSSQAKER